MGFPWPVYHSIRAGWALTTNHTLENIPIQAQGRYLLIFSILNKQGEIILGWLLVITQCEKKIIRIANRHILLSIYTEPMNYHPEVASGCFWTSERSLKKWKFRPHMASIAQTSLCLRTRRSKNRKGNYRESSSEEVFHNEYDFWSEAITCHWVHLELLLPGGSQLDGQVRENRGKMVLTAASCSLCHLSHQPTL